MKIYLLEPKKDKVTNYLYGQTTITRIQLRDTLNLSDRHSKRVIKQLVGKEVIVCIGENMVKLKRGFKKVKTYSVNHQKLKDNYMTALEIFEQMKSEKSHPTEVTSLPLTEVTSLPLTEVTSLPLTEVTSLPLTEVTSLPLTEVTIPPVQSSTKNIILNTKVHSDYVTSVENEGYEKFIQVESENKSRKNLLEQAKEDYEKDRETAFIENGKRIKLGSSKYNELETELLNRHPMMKTFIASLNKY